MTSLHGVHVHGFPNLFLITPAQGANLISNITSNLVESGRTIACVVARALDAGADEVEVAEAAEAAGSRCSRSNPRSFGGDPSCTPGYYNNEGGEITRKMRISTSGYPMGPVAFFEFIDGWRTSRATFDGSASSAPAS